MNYISIGFLKEATDTKEQKRKRLLRAAGYGIAVDLPISIGGSYAGARIARAMKKSPAVGATIGGLASYPFTIGAELKGLKDPIEKK